MYDRNATSSPAHSANEEQKLRARDVTPQQEQPVLGRIAIQSQALHASLVHIESRLKNQVNRLRSITSGPFPQEANAVGEHPKPGCLLEDISAMQDSAHRIEKMLHDLDSFIP